MLMSSSLILCCTQMHAGTYCYYINMSHWFKDRNSPVLFIQVRRSFLLNTFYLFFFSVNTYKMGSFSSMGLLWEIHFIKIVSPFEKTLNLYSTWRPFLIDVKGLVIWIFQTQSLPTCRLTKLSCASGDEGRPIQTWWFPGICFLARAVWFNR